jgi:hypothetical protein
MDAAWRPPLSSCRRAGNIGEHSEEEKRVRSAQAKLESGVLAKGGLSKTHRDYWIQ